MIEEIRDLSKFYAKVPESLLQDSRLNKTALCVYIYLKGIQDSNKYVFPTSSTIAKELYISSNCLFRALKKLELLGWIKRKKRPGHSNQYGCYTLVWNPLFNSNKINNLPNKENKLFLIKNEKVI